MAGTRIVPGAGTRGLDAQFMDLALRLAARGRGLTSPNPMVGAVVVTPDGVVVGSGYHARAGAPHAEVNALAAAGARARGATLYCSLEPCCHTGRTGPCTERIVGAGISRVVAAMADPHLLVRGGGFRFLREHDVEVVVGVRAAEATRLNEAFLTVVRYRRPFVTMKIALSLDGRIAAAPGVRTQLTSERAVCAVHRLRAEVDAVVVGVGTVLTDDPLLTVRGIHRQRPLTRVVLDRRLRTPVDARLLSTHATGSIVIVTTTEGAGAEPERVRALREAGAQVEVVPAPDLQTMLGRLAELRVTSLLLEGGATLHGAAWKARVVDRVQLYVAPRALGPRGVPWLSSDTFSIGSLQPLRVEPCGPDVLVEGDVHRAH